MKKFYKEIVCLFFVLVMMFSLCTTTFFASETLGVVNGSVINTDSTAGNADLADIQLDVYALIPVFSDSNQTDYDKQFAFSVSTDANGEYSFTKPSAICVVEINEDTVADGCGVLTGMDIIGAVETESELKIATIATYEIDLENNSIQFYNAQDEKLTVKENLNASSLSNVQLRTEEVELASVLSDTELAPVGAPPTYTNEVTYTDGFFTYHYESGTSTEYLDVIIDQLNYVYSHMSEVQRFLVPSLEPNKTTYQIYLVTGITTAGNFCIADDGGSYILLNPNYYGINTGRVEHTATHEYMHAISNEYTGAVGGDGAAFYEALSDCVSFLLSYHYYSIQVNEFMNSPELSLFDRTGNREYGAFIYPLYLYEEYSGFYTIKLILEEFAEVDSIYLAIDNVLRDGYNSSFLESYMDFRIKNYDFHSNYTFSGTNHSLANVQNSPKKTAITDDVVTYTTPMLSTMYFEFEAEVEDYYTFCFALQGTTDKEQVNLTGIYTSPDGEQTIIEFPFNSKLKMPNVLMEEGSKLCFLMSNINTTNTNIQFYTCIV